MLTKLIGYEMKAFGRIILPLYAATIGMALIMGLGVRVLDREVYSNILGAVIVMVFTTLILATMVMTGVLCVQRFYSNLLGKEGYLMFSLPVETHQLILSKVLSSLIWTLLGGVAGICTVAAWGLTAIPVQKFVTFFREAGIFIRRMSLGQEIGEAAVWLLIGILLFAASLMQIYAAMAIGHQWSSHRILGSILAYFGIDIVKSIIARLLGQIGLYTGWTSFFIANTEETGVTMGQVQVFVIISTIIWIVIYSVATWYFMDRRLNLE